MHQVAERSVCNWSQLLSPMVPLSASQSPWPEGFVTSAQVLKCGHPWGHFIQTDEKVWLICVIIKNRRQTWWWRCQSDAKTQSGWTWLLPHGFWHHLDLSSYLQVWLSVTWNCHYACSLIWIEHFRFLSPRKSCFFCGRNLATWENWVKMYSKCFTPWNGFLS